jgi:hypothetical protein
MYSEHLLDNGVKRLRAGLGLGRLRTGWLALAAAVLTVSLLGVFVGADA